MLQLHCHPSQFADDTGIYGSGEDAQMVANNVQKSLNVMEKWCTKWRINLCPSKTKVILFTKCYTKHKSLMPTLHLFHEQLTFVEEATFLGVKFNSSLTWEPQVRQLIAKAQPRLNLLRAMAAYSNNSNLNLLLQLYKAIVRPIFEYSSIAHVNAKDCHQNKLQCLQNAAIHSVLKTPSYISIKLLHDASGLPMLHERVINFAKKRLKSMKETSPLIQEIIDQFKSVSHINIWKSPLDFLI